MPKFVNQAWRETTTHYSLEFEYSQAPGAGYSFPCDANGVPDTSKINECGLKNFKEAVSGEIEGLVAKGIREWEHSYRHPAVIECVVCKQHVSLGSFTNTCNCGVDYNASGHKLAPRSCWGEETGEHWTECV